MRFDDTDCVKRCPRLVQVAQAAFERIPAADRDLIEQVCDVVFFGDGQFSPQGQLQAAAKFKPKERLIYVIRPNVEIPPLSDAAIQGIMAHEFGHACDYAERGGYGPEDSEESLERRADEYVTKWGFAADLQTARDEDKRRG